MWLKSIGLVCYLIAFYSIEQIACLNNRILMASRSTSRALSIPYDIAETLGVENQVNEPYRFSYKVQDNSDNMQFRNEEKTLDGNVKGSYGYKDANGIYRMVNYYSDATGFHAKVFSNEPGVLPRRDHVNSINRELFAKQTPLAYNPANVEWVINSNQPDFSGLNSLASEYNGDWRSSRSNDQTNSALYNREQYAFNGGDQYAGAASQVIESRRLNSVNNLYENEKKKLSLLVVPKNVHHHQNSINNNNNNKINNNNQVSINSDSAHSNYKQTILNAPIIAEQQPVNKPVQLIQPIQLVQQSQQTRQNQQNQQDQQTHQNGQNQNYQNHQVQFSSPQLQHQTISEQSKQPIISRQQQQQPIPSTDILSQPIAAVRKERVTGRRITGVRRVAKKAKDQTYFNPKVEITRRSDEGNVQSNENLSIKEFSTKFPEKWHQIFSSQQFNGNFEDKSNQQYAQLEAVRPDVSVLADQSFMKPVTKKESIQKQSLAKKIDRIGDLPRSNLRRTSASALPRKSVQYVPPLNSETLLTSATVHSSLDQSTSSQMLPRMMNPPTTSTTVTPQKSTINTNKVQSSITTTTTTIQSLTPTTLSSPINSSEITNPSTNSFTATTNAIITEQQQQQTKATTTTMSSRTIETTTTSQPTQTINEKEDQLKEKNKSTETVTELPLTTSTSVSIVTSTSIDQSKKNDNKATISSINRI